MIYLGGPIRETCNNLISDVEWRVNIEQLYGWVYFFNPLRENMSISDKNTIYRNNIKALDDSEFGVFNLTAFDTANYPCIGALFEIGYLTSKGKRCIVLCSEDSVLRKNPMLSRCTFVNVFYDMEVVVGELVKNLKDKMNLDQFLDQQKRSQVQ